MRSFFAPTRVSRPLSKKMIAALTPFVVFAAFVLLLLVSLSVPIIKSIDLFKLSAEISESVGPVSVNANGNVRYGVWGYCISAIEATCVLTRFRIC